MSGAAGEAIPHAARSAPRRRGAPPPLQRQRPVNRSNPPGERGRGRRLGLDGRRVELRLVVDHERRAVPLPPENRLDQAQVRLKNPAELHPQIVRLVQQLQILDVMLFPVVHIDRHVDGQLGGVQVAERLHRLVFRPQALIDGVVLVLPPERGVGDLVELEPHDGAGAVHGDVDAVESTLLVRHRQHGPGARLAGRQDL